MDWFQGKSKPETMFLFFLHEDFLHDVPKKIWDHVALGTDPVVLVVELWPSNLISWIFLVSFDPYPGKLVGGFNHLHNMNANGKDYSIYYAQ